MHFPPYLIVSDGGLSIPNDKLEDFVMFVTAFVIFLQIANKKGTRIGVPEITWLIPHENAQTVFLPQGVSCPAP